MASVVSSTPQELRVQMFGRTFQMVDLGNGKLEVRMVWGNGATLVKIRERNVQAFVNSLQECVEWLEAKGVGS